jgi:hypothetical protein
MGERYQVWEHGDNLFPGFKCKYCVKEFCGGVATRLKEYLAGKRGGGGGGVKGLFKRATSQGERHRDFDAARAKTLVQARNFEDPE